MKCFEKLKGGKLESLSLRDCTANVEYNFRELTAEALKDLNDTVSGIDFKTEVNLYMNKASQLV